MSPAFPPTAWRRRLFLFVSLLGPISGLVLAVFLIREDARMQPSSASRRVDFQFYVRSAPDGDHIDRLIDFTGHLHFIRAVWSGQLRHPYRLDAVQSYNRQTVGPHLVEGFFSPYAPPFFILYTPFLPLGTSWAYLAFTLLGISAWAAVVRTVVLPHPTAPALSLMVVGLVGLSADFANTIYHGASALLTTSALLIVFHWLYDPVRNAWKVPGHFEKIAMVAVLVAVAAKPNAALPLFVLVAMAGQWRAIIISVSSLLLLSAILTPLLGGWPDWVLDYLALLSRYNPEQIGDFFRHVVRPELYTSWPAAFPLNRFFSYAAATKISLFLWLVSILLLLRFAPRLASPRTALWWIVSGFLLLNPCLTQCEDLLWIALPVCLGGTVVRTRHTVLIAALLIIILNTGRNGGMPPWIQDYPWAIAAKLLLAAFVFRLLRTMPAGDQRDAEGKWRTCQTTPSGSVPTRVT